ncbi:maleylpyruvate isomerase N-terminal domain-containing protein [Streptomyces sp. IBSBF 2435]|uniref:maleylpyruvate isomerase N-terminal domain-containing protein n=1 Tax=Streptomyces sp. IBSBF 2435 TaxID=2903531 RepID=UPI002FDB96E8
MTVPADADLDPSAALDRIAAATGHLLLAAEQSTEAGVRGPSLLPGWSRGHVLTHLARNADGGRHLLFWARTGVETPEYPSPAARAEQIEAGAGPGAAALVAGLRDSSARFAEEYRRMPRRPGNARCAGRRTTSGPRPGRPTPGSARCWSTTST